MRLDDKLAMEIIGLGLFLYYITTELAEKIGMNLAWFIEWTAIFSVIMFLVDSVILWWHLGKYANYKSIIVSSIAAGGFLSLLFFYVEFL